MASAQGSDAGTLATADETYYDPNSAYLVQGLLPPLRSVLVENIRTSDMTGEEVALASRQYVISHLNQMRLSKIVKNCQK